MKVWQVTYYQANRWGSMQEYGKRFPSTMTIWEVRSKMDRWVSDQQSKGKPIFPQYDVAEENVA